MTPSPSERIAYASFPVFEITASMTNFTASAAGAFPVAIRQYLANSALANSASSAAHAIAATASAAIVERRFMFSLPIQIEYLRLAGQLHRHLAVPDRQLGELAD